MKLQQLPPYEPKTITTSMTTYHQLISEPHSGEYNNNVKSQNSGNVRTFDKERSVFKDWKLDKLEPM